MNLPDHQTLQALGMSLLMVGVLLRGFAESARRDLARRKQHRIDDRKSPVAHLTAELTRPAGWFERNLGLLANIILVAGVVITVAGFARS